MELGGSKKLFSPCLFLRAISPYMNHFLLGLRKRMKIGFQKKTAKFKNFEQRIHVSMYPGKLIVNIQMLVKGIFPGQIFSP
jgi:hypothetical protein